MPLNERSYINQEKTAVDPLRSKTEMQKVIYRNNRKNVLCYSGGFPETQCCNILHICTLSNMNENRLAYRVVTHRQIRLIGKIGGEDNEDRSIQRAALVRTPVGLCRKHKK